LGREELARRVNDKKRNCNSNHCEKWEKDGKASSHGSLLKTAAVLPEFLDSFLKSVVINSSSRSEEIESSVL